MQYGNRALMTTLLVLILMLVISGFAWAQEGITSANRDESNTTASVTDPYARAWSDDIDFIVNRIEAIHPDPFHRVEKSTFRNEAEKLKKEILDLSEEERVVRAMQWVASLRDGHTVLTPYRHPLVVNWYPLRMDRFDDGVFVTAIDKRHEDIVGTKVLRIGTRSAEDAFQLVGSVTSVDSPFLLHRTVPTYLSNALILKGLKITDDDHTLALEVALGSGAKRSVLLSAIQWPFDLGWARDRNIVPGNKECVTAYGPIMEDLPLHLKRLLTSGDKYWFEVLPGRRAIYFQFNSVTGGAEQFSQFVSKMWDAYQAHAREIDKFVVDVRYNEGGNGALLRPLLHEFIRHQEVDQRGKLFVIMGRNTFSAASNFVGQMVKHTNAITVGEPAGPVNWFSDIERLLAPSGRIGLDISTMHWQEGHPLDKRGYFPPEYPVVVTARDHFSGKDSALEKILGDEVSTLIDIVQREGAVAFRAEYRRWSDSLSAREWWFPYTVFDLRKAGVDLFTSGRKEESIAVFKLNTALHPDIYWVWEILGNVYADVGNREGAIDCLNRALTLNPHDVYVRESLENLSDSSMR